MTLTALDVGLHVSGVPTHLHDGLRRYVEQYIRPGAFLYACLTNDLAGAVARADPTVLPRLHTIIGFLDSYAPKDCYGSPAKVEQWLQIGRERRFAAHRAADPHCTCNDCIAWHDAHLDRSER